MARFQHLNPQRARHLHSPGIARGSNQPDVQNRHGRLLDSDRHGSGKWLLVFLGIWIIIQTVPAIQVVFPLYRVLRLREIGAVALVLLAILRRKHQGDGAIWLLSFLISVYVFIGIARSDLYDLETQLRLFARLVIMFCLVPTISQLIDSMGKARLFLFSCYYGAAFLLCRGRYKNYPVLLHG